MRWWCVVDEWEVVSAGVSGCVGGGGVVDEGEATKH